MKRYQPFLFSFLGSFSLLFAACGGSETPPKTTADAAPTRAYGIEIFKQNCITCHGADGKMGMNGAYDLSVSKLTVAERVAVITNGRKAMTPFKALLNAEEIQAVAEYTTALKQ